MSFPYILHYDVNDGVNSSCQQLLMGAQHSLLIDCDLFQGAESSVQCNAGADWLAVAFPPDLINALAAAHVHIDHVGRIPYPQSGEKKCAVFSSDLGAPQELLSPAPKPPYRADILVAENAYGDRLHEDRRTRRRCSGRIVNHLKTMLLTHGAAFCWSATRQGTPGRVGKNGGYAVLDGQRCDIRAQIHTIGGYSAHAG
ncbi:hypothetical protein [Pseudomonas sp. BN515]|uniref:hypothetical protein n=1 Tax=Pseudomonas sp. BN515 TaxID=2567892 RepID=UPI0024587512|nr:hypothetical protein [Pseudomonas sp. BN515]